MFSHSKNNGNGPSSGPGPDEHVWQPLPQDDFANIGMPNLVYVKAVKAEDLTAESVGGSLDVDAGALKSGEVFYAVHAANGARMAVLGSREAAFAGAVQYDFMPVNVH